MHAGIYHCINVAHRLLRRRPDLRDLFVATWYANCFCHGPLARLQECFHSLQATWIEPYLISAFEGTS